MMKHIDDITNSEFDSLISETDKLDYIVLAGTNPNKPVDGEKCKALLLLDGKPLVFYNIEAIFESGLANKILINGPVKRLKASLEPHLIKAGIKDYVFVQEEKPGGTKQIVHNIIDTLKYVESKHPITIVVGGDMVGNSSAYSRAIMTDMNKRYTKDLRLDEVEDYYYPLADAGEDATHFEGLDDQKRPGMPINKKKKVKIGGYHGVNSHNLVAKAELIEDLLENRKIVDTIKKSPFSFLKYLNGRIGIEGMLIGLKGMLNYLKQSDPGNLRTPARIAQKILSPLPYFNISLYKAEMVILSSLDTKTSFFLTKGAADVDTDSDYLASKEVIENGKI